MLILSPKLKTLDLSLPYRDPNTAALFQYDLVFPAHGNWPQLTAFTIHKLAIGTKDLLSLVTARMPRLREFGFEEIELLDGKWSMIGYVLQKAYQCCPLADKLAMHAYLPHREDVQLSGPVLVLDMDRGSEVPAEPTDKDELLGEHGFLPEPSDIEEIMRLCEIPTKDEGEASGKEFVKTLIKALENRVAMEIPATAEGELKRLIGGQGAYRP